MSIIDQLKEQSRQQSCGAAPATPLEREPSDDAAAAESEAPEPPKPPPAAAAPGASGPPDYCAFWIEHLEKVKGLPPEAAAAAVRDAIRAAPAHHRPPDEDAQLFAAAGGRELPYSDVVAWLRLRAVVPAIERTLEPDVARFWRDQLGPPPAAGTSAASWSSRCRDAARAAAQVGCGLNPATVAALAAHPGAVLGYLNCAASSVHRSAPPSAVPPPATSASPPTAGSPPFSGPPLGASATVPTAFGATAGGAGSRLGFALGGLVGGVVGGVVGGFKAGAASFSKWRSETDHPAGYLSTELRRAAAEAERASATFTDAARQLNDHPRLVSFWREVDLLAAGRFAGARDGVLREMAAQRQHPLHLLFERHARNDPGVALHHRRALEAFERLQATWEVCAQAHQKRGEHWAPGLEAVDALRAACRRTPAAGGQPALVDQAERLLRVLAQTIRETCARATGRRPSPAGRAPSHGNP